MEGKVLEAIESNVRSYCREFPAVFDRGSGALLYDRSGKAYLDFLCGAGALNYGHNPPALIEKIIEYLSRQGVLTSLDLHTTAKEEFLAVLHEVILKPRSLADYKVQFTGPTGANAIEAALKLCRLVTDRTNIIAFTNGYHGASLGALSVTGNRAMRGAAGLPLGYVTRMPYQGFCGESNNRLLAGMLENASSGVDLPAAVIVETVQGEGGIHTATADWLQELQAVAHKFGALFVVDDIQAGCGRTGTFFSFERMGLAPDLICMSKSIGAVGMPLALVLIRPEYDQWTAGQHNGTFRGNNLAFVAGAAALKHYWGDEKFQSTLDQKVADLDVLLRPFGEKYDHIKVRGRGFLRGLAFEDGDFARKVSQVSFQNGLIVETCGPRGEVLKLLPPINCDNEILERGIRILLDAVDQVVRQDH